PLRYGSPHGSLLYCSLMIRCCTSCCSIIIAPNLCSMFARRPGSSEVPLNPLTRWDVSSIPANGIFLTKKIKK
ncbi:unnamed protein product, partial [Ascophyllum nodosum]